MISGPEIAEKVRLGIIEIEPFNLGRIQPNSYDITLGEEVVELTYNSIITEHEASFSVIDTAKPGCTIDCKKTSSGGYLIWPGTVYLGHTVERIHSDEYAPMIDGRSSVARHGLVIHLTAGFGDVGFNGQFTLEIANPGKYPIVIYPGTRIGQVFFEKVEGDIELYNSGYQLQTGARPSKGVL